MKNNTVKIALAQLKAENGNKKTNLKRAICAIDDAAYERADIIVFPELYYCGYDVSKDDLTALAEPSDGEMFHILRAKAMEKRIHIAMGYPEIDKSTHNLYISFMMIDDQGKLIHNHRKSYVWTEDLDRVTPGNSFDVFETKFGKMGMLTCYEMEFPEPARILALKGAEIVIVSSAFMDTELMEKDLSAIAVQNSMHVAGVNNISKIYKGKSLFADQYGNITAEASSRYEELLIHTIDLNNDRRKTYPAYNDYKNMFIENTLKLYDEASANIINSK